MLLPALLLRAANVPLVLVYDLQGEFFHFSVSQFLPCLRFKVFMVIILWLVGVGMEGAAPSLPKDTTTTALSLFPVVIQSVA